MAVLKNWFRFPEIGNFVTSAWGPGIKKSLRNPLGGGHFTKERALMVAQNLTKKMSNAQWSAWGGDGLSLI